MNAITSSAENIKYLGDLPAYPGLSPLHRLEGIRAATNIVDTLLRSAPPAAQQRIAEKIAAARNLIGRFAYEHVNPARVPNPEFDQQLDANWSRTRNKGSLHLELGAWTAWPEERVANYVASEGIGDFIRLDMQSNFPIDVAASVTALPFADNSIDRISSNSLLEHCPYPHEILAECLRVLRPGGALYSAVPFHFVQHDCPSDYLRFTGAFFQDVCKDLGFAEVATDTKSASGLFYTLHTLAKSALVDEYTQPELRDFARQLHVAVISLLVLAQGFDDEIVCGGASHFHTTKFFAVKAGQYIPSTSTFNRNDSFLLRHRTLFVCPKTLKSLVPSNHGMIDINGQIAYPVSNGVPEMFVMHGAQSVNMLAKEVERLKAILQANKINF